MTLVMAISAPTERMSAAHSPTPAPAFSASASGASEPASLAGRREPDGDDGDDDVEQRADQQRADDRVGQITARVLGLLAGRRDGVEPDVGEEDQRGRVDRAVEAVGRPGREVVAVDRSHADHDEEDEDGDLHEDHERVRARALAYAVNEQRGHRQHEEDGREVGRPAVAGRAGDDQAGRCRTASRAATSGRRPSPRRPRPPRRRTRGSGPRRCPGHELAQRRVAVRVCAPETGIDEASSA